MDNNNNNNNNNNNHHKRVTDKVFTILCIDDESINLKILTSIFKEDYRVIVCKTAQQGFAKAMAILPDLILLDVIMPDESGFELIVKLKHQVELNHIPVIFVTGLQNIEDEEKGLNLGACDYIQKPFHHGIVRARIKTHLELVRQRKLLDKYAHVDSLTELSNRRKWQNDSSKQWQASLQFKTPLVIGIVDIDFFKKYNDHYGHQLGDSILRQVSNVIRRYLFSHGGEVYRCGGEEFYFYLPYHQKTDIKTILDECVDRVIQLNIAHQKSPVSPFLSISIGAIQVTANESLTMEQVINLADQQLYQVKNTNRNAAKLDILTP
ncbi:MAG: diguanylate cyclase response regulator [Gammaproteobacteria bacterium]|nr:MAG: diguanylate cyclase response regulator [Gammaproteobacteria bacterium]